MKAVITDFFADWLCSYIFTSYSTPVLRVPYWVTWTNFSVICAASLSRNHAETSQPHWHVTVMYRVISWACHRCRGAPVIHTYPHRAIISATFHKSLNQALLPATLDFQFNPLLPFYIPIFENQFLDTCSSSVSSEMKCVSSEFVLQ